MQKKLATAIALLFVAAALAAGTTGAAVEEDVNNLVPSDALEYTQEELMALGFNQWIIGFSELPMDRSEYAGYPVTLVLEGINVLVVEAPEPVTLKARAAMDDRVRYVEYDDPNYGNLLYTPNDPLHTHSALWGTHRVGAEAAWDVTLGSTAVKIAVVDSGLNKDHEEFAGQARVLDGWNFHGGNSDTSDHNGCNYHGTHVSGTLGATIDNGVGIAGLSQSSILPVKIFGSGFFGCGAASTTNIANALMFAGDEGAHISQNSWGGGGSSTAINDAIAYSHNKGTIHVAAAGNSGSCTNCVSQPWVENADKVNIVSSSDDDDGFSSFSSEGPQVTVIAPGRGVGSSTSGTSDYHIMSGTSMAAPHVSGSIALYLAMNGGASFNNVRNALTSTAEDLGHSSDRQGAGMVRADLMLGADGGGGGSDPEPDPEPEPEPSNEMHVHSISHGSSGGRPATRDLHIDIEIRDANENGVASVDICVDVTRNSDGLNAQGCGTTDANGDIRFVWSNVGRDNYTSCVTSLTKTDWTWDTTADHASDGNCHTSST